MNTILVVGAGVETIPGIKIAHDMDLRVVASDGNPCAPAFKDADAWLYASTYDIGATIYEAKEYSYKKEKIKGVISIGCDVPLTVARTAHELGLPHIPIRTATICSNKLVMANVLKQSGVPVPEFYSVCGSEQLPDDDKVYVIKPLDSRGARGVVRLLPGIDKVWAYREAQAQSKINQVMVQEWLDGPQLSTEGIVLRGKYYHIASIDRNYARLDQFAPFVIEDGGSQPSRLRTSDLELIPYVMQKAVDAIGLDYGTIKGDLVIHDHAPYVIEVAPRLSGGYMSTDQIPLATGVNLVKHAIDLCMGKYPQPEDVQPKKIQAVAIRYEFPKYETKSHVDRGQHVIISATTPELAIWTAENDVLAMAKSRVSHA